LAWGKIASLGRGGRKINRLAAFLFFCFFFFNQSLSLIRVALARYFSGHWPGGGLPRWGEAKKLSRRVIFFFPLL